MYTAARRGFTIVELLIVIVVIAVLAAIITVVFNQLQTRAIKSSLTSDAKSAAAELEVYKVTNSSSRYPYSETLLNNGSGFKKASTSSYQYTYVSSSNSYCLTIYSVRNPNVTYMVSDTDRTPTEGICPNHSSTETVARMNSVSVSTHVNTGSRTPGMFGTSYAPSDIALAPDGSMYVSHDNEYRIVKISPDGTKTPYAGSGTRGYLNGPAATARFETIQGLALDATGNLLVAELFAIRKVDTSGNVTTLAGTGSSGSTDGFGTAASVHQPNAMAIAQDGTIYVADSSNRRVRKITPAGQVTTLAGSTSGHTDGTGSAAQFVLMNGGIAVGSDGTIYILDRHSIRKITPSGVVSTFVGSPTEYGITDGQASTARIGGMPYGLAIDQNDNLYFSENSTANVIRKVTPDGTIQTIAGAASGDVDGSGFDARFGQIKDLQIKGNTLYAVDSFNLKIRALRF